jgi:glycosyltransferase involved in cell wall biosynthesis
MKVLLLISSNEGTIAKVSYNLYLNLKNRKEIDLHVINFNKSSYSEYHFENCYDINFIRINNNIIRQFINILKLFKFIQIKKNIKPEITISTQELCTSISILSRGKDKKIGIFHAPYYQSKSSGQINFYLQFLSYKFLYSKLDAFFCVSKEIKNSILNKFSIDESKLKVVYNVHNFDEILLKSEEKIEENQEFLFDGKSILYVGRFDKNKAPNRLVKSFYELKQTKKINDDVKLIFIGSGEEKYENYLRNLILKLDLQKSVFLLGFKSNPYNYIRRATILVSSSFSEGLPGVIIESIFLKTPVVTTNSSLGIWEIFDCDHNYDINLEDIYIARNGIITSNLLGYHNERQNILSLKKGLEILLNDNMLYNQLRNNDFKFIKLLNKNSITQNFFQV